MKKQKTESRSAKKKTIISDKMRSGIGWKEMFSSHWKIPLILTFFVVIFSIRQVSNFDIGFHLAGGRWIIENL